MTDTANLGLPYIDAAQAQKHVTHNEALRILDTLVQLAVLDRDLAAPPGAPSEGRRWIVAASPAGAWIGHAGHIAAWQDSAWKFSVPAIGWLAYVIDEGRLLTWSGTAWVDALSVLTTLQNITLLGVGTTADATNPFSAKLSNALWVAKTVAEGGDGTLRYKLSKESAAKTLSFLFQDNYSGRAEVGLTGDDDFHFKVSGDGSSWIDALTLDKSTGTAKLNSAVQWTAKISPPQITSDQNNYNPPGFSTATVLRLSTDANSGNGRKVTGLTGGADGRIILVLNVGGNPLILTNQDSASTATNRFQIGRNYTLLGNEGVLLVYDVADSRWKLMAQKSRPTGLFAVNRGTAQTGLTAGNFNKLQLNTEEIDAEGWYDNTTNYRYTPQEPGWYWFYCNCQVTYDATNVSSVVSIDKNGTNIKQGSPLTIFSSNVVIGGSSNIGALVQMNGSTDYVEFSVYVNSVNGATIAMAARNHAGGWKVADL
jgi:hypothetical protein